MNMKNAPLNLERRVAQNASRPLKRQSSKRRNAARRPNCQCFLKCPSIFSTRSVNLSCIVFVDAEMLPDLFSRPPKGSDAHLLDGEGPQQIPYQQIITT